MKNLPIIFSFISVLILYGCSAKTTIRYEKPKETTRDNTTTTKINLKEEFDYSQFRKSLDLPEENLTPTTVPSNYGDIWYDYESSTPGDKVIVNKTNGFRVLVLVTDILDQANEMRSDIYFKTNQRAIYVDFESPFYRVKVGDYTDINKARELSFRLNQMGYQAAKVIPDSVNVFE